MCGIKLWLRLADFLVMGTPPPLPPQVIYPKPKKYVVQCVLGGLGALLAVKAGAGAVAILVLVMIAVLLVQFMTSWIRLDEQGFTFKSMWRSSSYRWEDVDAAKGFYVMTQSVNFVKTNSYVCWNFAPSYQKSRIVRAASRMFGRAEALIHPLGHDAMALAVLMTGFLLRARARSEASDGRMVSLQ
jgi:hypothetical protein